MKITIGHLYPDLLNLYGDRGNIQCMMKRCQWRGIEAETLEFKLEDEVDFFKLSEYPPPISHAGVPLILFLLLLRFLV